MKVILGHAVYDENGKSSGGAKGDQTSKEVTTWNYYISGGKKWQYVIRLRNEAKRQKLADKIYAACNNDNIGYSQSDRLSLYEAAKKTKFNIGKISTKCNCDCSSLVACCLNAIGIKVPHDCYTGNLRKALDDTNAVDIFVDTNHLTSMNNLEVGDILLREGHHVAVVVKKTN